MRRWRRFVALDPAQRRTFLQAIALLPVAALGLRWLGLRRIQRLFAVPVSGGVHPGAEETARLVAAAARHGPYRASCLPTALTLQWLLRRQGIEAELRLGVRKERERLEAHAWLEHEGRPLMDTREDLEPYAAFDRAVADSAGPSR